MSYTLNTKREIMDNRPLRQRYKNQQAYGLLLFSRNFSVEEVALTTIHRTIARFYASVVQGIIPIRGTITTQEEKRGSQMLYHVSLDEQHDRWELFNHFAMLYPEGVTYDLLGGDQGTAAFVGGAFLACGSLTDPHKNYHIEFAVPRQEAEPVLTGVLGEVGFRLGVTTRRGLPLIYSHESEQMEDLLTFMGCPQMSLELMNVKILKERRNAANRAANCDNANINKVVDAAAAQLAAINAIGVGNLPEELRELAQLRLDNPDDSLRELGQKLNPPLSRSGVNHRMTRILKAANGE